MKVAYPMTHHDAFLQAILNQPADPAPRLVYADWLEEQGDGRAELFRLQHELTQRADFPGRWELEARQQKLLNAGVPPVGVITTNSLGMKFALIPPGEFLMGSPEDEPGRGEDEFQHLVRITQPFHLGVYQVTQAEYEQVMGTNPSYFQREQVGQDTLRFPVERVSWEDAVEFCRRLSALSVERAAGRVYRLPTEAEWEFACRAGTTTATAFGASLSIAQANFFGRRPYNGAAAGPSPMRTTTVGSYRSNAWGLYDMHGNVYEWCQDWYDDYDTTLPPTDPQGPSSQVSYRVLRGGGWRFIGCACRSANRGWGVPGNGNDYRGFRVALVPSS